MAHSDKQGTNLPVESSPRTRNLRPFGPSESLVDDFPGLQSQNAGTASLNQPQVDVTKRLSWSPPACYDDIWNNGPDGFIVTDMHDLQKYFLHDLSLRAYDDIHKYLWWAAVGSSQDSIHEYFIYGQSICQTEEHANHEVEKNNVVYLKPLPEYLLCYTLWDFYLCKDDELYANAIGLLRSYMTLDRSQIDFKIAQDKLLLPAEITWQQWSAFSYTCFSKCPLRSCNPRYWYGGLAENRLTWVRRFTHSSLFLPRWIPRNYSQRGFIQENTTWLLAALIYITIVLTAMQVGLATEQLGANTMFTRASYGFTIFSIIAPLAILFAVTTIAVLKTSVLLSRLQRSRLRMPPYLDQWTPCVR